MREGEFCSWICNFGQNPPFSEISQWFRKWFATRRKFQNKFFVVYVSLKKYMITTTLFELVEKLSRGIKKQIESVMSIAFNYWLHRDRNLLIKFVSRWQQNDHNQFPKEHNQPVFGQKWKYILHSFLLTTALTEIPLDETTWEARTICLSPTVAIVAIFSKCPINKWTAEILSWNEKTEWMSVKEKPRSWLLTLGSALSSLLGSRR